MQKIKSQFNQAFLTDTTKSSVTHGWYEHSTEAQKHKQNETV